MTRIVLRIEECCAGRRKPVRRRQTPSCADAPTYSGILLRGQWKKLDDTPSVSASA